MAQKKKSLFILALLASVLSAAVFAATQHDLIISTYAVSSDFTLAFNGQCSTEIGVIPRKAEIKIKQEKFAKICQQSQCEATIHASASCGGAPIAAFSLDESGKVIAFVPLELKNYYIDGFPFGSPHFYLNIKELKA